MRSYSCGAGLPALIALVLLVSSTPASSAVDGTAAPDAGGTGTSTSPRITSKSPAAGSLVTDPLQVFTEPIAVRPPYLVSLIEPTFGTQLMRVGNNPSQPLVNVSGTWGSDARHVYSKQQPWSSDNSMLVIENHGGGSPTPLILDGKTYLPKLAPCSNYAVYDYRWHPSPAHPHEQINVEGTGTELMWFDVTTCTKTRTWALPIAVDYGIGSGEGNPSNDGRFVALGNQQAMFIVDMDPQPPFAPYPSKRIGPVYSFPPCSLSTTPCTIGNLSVSPSGRYVDVKYSESDSLADVHRIYEIDPTTLALKPHNMASSSLRCGSFAARPNGWIYPMKHADMALDPFDANEDVIVGGRACPGSALGHVIKVRLRDGKVTALTDPTNESSVYHVSTRNIDRPGWAYVSYFPVDGKRFSDEIIAVKLDGSLAVERYGHTHTAASGCYRCEAHPVPSRDGSRVLFASNWAFDCGLGCGDVTDIKDYVFANPLSAQLDTPYRPVSVATLALGTVWPNPSRRLPAVAYTLASSAPATLELLDIAGRRVLLDDLGAPGPGPHELSLDGRERPRPGMYWLRLRQDERTVTRSIVLTP